jgi:hypothetical protein
MGDALPNAAMSSIYDPLQVALSVLMQYPHRTRRSTLAGA